MNSIIYGSERPKISFTQSPEGSISFVIENERRIQLNQGYDDNISWFTMFPSKWKLNDKSIAELLEIFQQFTQEMADLTMTGSERKFFLDYVQECLTSADQLDRSVWEYPGLIPQSWVNWIHYDPENEVRAKRAQKEPFRVDFMLKDTDISPKFVIFEIDGSSHFGNIEIYTEHLRKDRWLRNQGWQVFRISNLEIDQCTDFNYFYYELTGKFISIPF